MVFFTGLRGNVRRNPRSKLNYLSILGYDWLIYMRRYSVSYARDADAESQQ